MNVLVIGGQGFIGTQLCRALVNKCHNVVSLDDGSNALENSDINVEEFIRINGPKEYYYRALKGSVEDINRILNFDQFDVIYHLASESRPLMFSEKADKIVNANVGGLRVICNQLKPSQKLIYASTSEIYGEQAVSLWESLPGIINPSYQRNIYSISKMLCESILQNREDLNWNIVRLFNVYGPENREDDTKIIPTIIKCAKEKIPFRIVGDGKNRRSYSWIDDIVEALVKIPEKGVRNQTYNLGRDAHCSIEELIEIVRKFIPFNVELTEARIGEPKIRICCSDRAQADLDWRANTRLEEGLERIFKYHGIIM